MASSMISLKDRQDTFIELRLTTFNLFLGFVSVTAAALIWLSNISARTYTREIVLLWLVVELTCLISWWLRRYNLQAAIMICIGGLWLCNAFAARFYALPFFLYLFALISMATSVLTGRITALIITVISSVFIATQGNLAIDSTLLLPMVAMWFTLLTSFIAFSSLYQALDMALSYQDYAIQQMLEAREHRANLMKTTKVLNDVRQDLERANTQLIHAHKAAEEARRLKAQFAANVSHELRTPINLIVGFSETIVVSPDSYGIPLPPVYWADMRTIYRSAKHLQSLINDVLDVSQIEAGKMAIVKEEINPQQVITEAGNLARDLIESRGLEFELDLPPAMPTMYLDRTRIRQVILNLLSNAARFTDHGKITVAATLEASHLCIAVTDTGIGIPPKDLNSVFEEFHQVEGSLSRRRDGTGLGLTLSKQFVELHGGRIWAESEGVPGKGTTFNFTLPFIEHSATFKPSGEATSTAVSPDNKEQESSARYFVVLDDDPAILQLFERHTQKHRAVGVGDYEEALRLVDAIRPATLVIGNTDDYDRMLNTLRATDNQTPIIACAMPSGRRGLQRYGTDVHLVKPATGEAMREVLEKLSPLTHNIVIIADDHDMIRMFTRMLQAMPYRVLKAYSSEEGLALMQQERPDAVILDILMSNEAGETIIDQMRANPFLAHIPIIVASASGDVDELTPAAEGRILVGKASGFEPMELVKCVEALVDVFTPANEPARSKIPSD